MFQPKICRKSASESGRKLKKCLGGPPNIYLSRIQNSSLYLLPAPNDNHFTNCTVFLGHPVCCDLVFHFLKNVNLN